MKEEDKTGGLRLEERGVAPTEKREGGKPASPGPESGEELLVAARALLAQWSDMRPGHRGLVLAAADMDVVFDEAGFDLEATKLNTGAIAVFGNCGVANLAVIVAVNSKKPLRLAKDIFKLG